MSGVQEDVNERCGSYEVGQGHCEGSAVLKGGIIHVQHEWLEGAWEVCHEALERLMVDIRAEPHTCVMS